MDENQELGWLIRDTSNRIRGPFKQAEIVQLIKKGQLKGKTEISRANSYWFAIEEKAELGRFLPEFNGGKPPPEAPTQMTATLTSADVEDHGVEITTFTAVPKKDEAKEGASPEAAAQSEGQIEWLSDEFAEEFGEDFGTTISVQTNTADLKAPEAAPVIADDTPEALKEQPTPKDSGSSQQGVDEKAKQEMLRRATVKADTLPSEHKSFQGDRPKPIDTLMRSPVKPGTSAMAQSQHAMVNVPVEDGPAPKMFIEEDEAKVRERKSRRNLIIFSLLGVILLSAIGSYIFLHPDFFSKKVVVPVKPVRHGEEAAAASRQSVLLFDLEGAKSALADLEMEPGARGEASTYLAQAVVKKEFLFDVEGAMLALQTARSQARNKRTEAEVDNLMAIYGFDRDPAGSTEMLRRNLEAYKDDPVFRYNLALSLLRINKPQEAIPLLEALMTSMPGDNPLVEDAALAQGWALESYCLAGVRDSLCKRSADAEDAFLRALSSNPNSAKARLGLALFRLRRGGIKNSESDFRNFLDSAPDLDPPTRVVNYRKLSNSDFYTFAHAQIVDLNTPSQTMNKPSPLIMAVDAIIAAMQSRTSEGGKILEGALSSAPGDVNVLKALGYIRWKDGQVNEMVDSLKDLKDRNSFGVNLMLGKGYSKLRKKDLAEKHFRALVETFPNRSEGHSLLGELLADQADKIEEAKSEFHLALKKDPLDIIALRGLQKATSNLVLSPELQRNLPF